MQRLASIFLIFCVSALPCTAATNLLSNGDFEEAESNFLFGTSFTDWNFGAEIAIETSDVYNGTQALRTVRVNTPRSLSQAIELTGDVTGQEYELTIHYKVLSAAEGDIRLNSEWSYYRPQSGTPQDSAILNQTLISDATSIWRELTVKTTKPQEASFFSFSVYVNKGVQVIFDDFRFVRTEKQTPWYTIMPETVGQVNANIGDSALVANFTIRQGNLSSPVLLSITGTDANMFSIEKQQAIAAEENIKVWYKPTAVGNHTAYLLTDNGEALGDSKIIRLRGTGSDPTQKPEIHIQPTSLPPFTSIVGISQTDSIEVSSTNCIEDITVTLLNDNTPSAFVISSTLIPKNMTGKTYITFRPTKAGNYSASIYWSTKNGQTQQLRVSGVATASGTETPDWATTFDWDVSQPTALLQENFDSVNHNSTLLIKDWQNVVIEGERPWWGYEIKDAVSGNTTERCAKATAYIYQEADSVPYEMWLVTPALDYANAANQVFTFRVRGDYMSKSQSATLGLYYVDASDSADIYMQDLQIEMPSTEDQAGDWLDFQVNLSGQPLIPDVFFMAFRFRGNSGQTGAATYLIDDVSWGRTDLPVIYTDSNQVVATTLPNTQIALPITIIGNNLTENISISVEGNNRSKFQVAPTTLPADGGVIAVGFKSETEGVHEAYLRIRSRGAVDVYIPMAILVKSSSTQIENTTENEPYRIVLEGGNIYILTQKGKYTLTGRIL